MQRRCAESRWSPSTCMSTATAGPLTSRRPLQHVGAFPPCSIMMVHGLADRSVPIEGHRAIFDALAPFYLDHPQDCVFLTHSGGHGIRPSVHRLGWEWLLERLEG